MANDITGFVVTPMVRVRFRCHSEELVNDYYEFLEQNHIGDLGTCPDGHFFTAENAAKVAEFWRSKGLDEFAESEELYFDCLNPDQRSDFETRRKERERVA